MVDMVCVGDQGSNTNSSFRTLERNRAKCELKDKRKGEEVS